MLKGKSDIVLIEEILQGRQDSFDLLYHKYSKLYMSICIRYFNSKQDAEDLLQEAFIKIYRNLSQYDKEKASFITWSKKIVVNTCLEKLRKPNFLNFIGNIFDFNKKTNVIAKADENLNLKDLTLMIQNLPKGTRTVFNLYAIDGYTHKEIAGKLGISISTSKTQLMKAKNKLKISIEEEGFQFETSYG